MHEAAKRELADYQKKFICPKEEDLAIFGDYDSATALVFNIQFIMCHNRTDCKSREEIMNYLRDTFIMIAYNQIIFEAMEDGTKAVSRKSKIKYLQIST